MVKKLSVLIIMLLCAHGFAQKTSSSPYSALGIGDNISSKTVEEMSMGGVGTATNEVQLSFSNPASYSTLTLTTYALAVENRAISLKNASEKDKASNANLSYLAIGIPLGVKGGFVLGIQPNTSIGYKLINNKFDSSGDIRETTIYEGEGGTNRAFLGFGYNLFKGVSIGLEGQYIFGNTERSIINLEKNVQLATKYGTDGLIKGFAFKVGFLYRNKLKEKLLLSLGATLGLKNELKSTGNEYLHSVSYATGREVIKQTLLDISSTGTYKSPLKTSLGVSIGNPRKWSLMIDYSFQNAIELKGNLLSKNPNLKYQKSKTLSGGAFYIPKFNSISSYWNRVIYRAGAHVRKTGMIVKNTGINDFGISFGVGLPMGNQVSKLNLGFEFGKRGTLDNGLIKENYFNFRLGLSLNNKWFRKREIN